VRIFPHARTISDFFTYPKFSQPEKSAVTSSIKTDLSADCDSDQKYDGLQPPGVTSGA